MFNSRIILGHSVDKCRYFDIDYLIIPKGFFVILNASFLGCRVTQRRFWELPWPTKDSLANNFLFRKMIAYFGNRGYGPMFRRFINMDSTLCTTFEFLRIHRSQKMRSSMGFFQNALSGYQGYCQCGSPACGFSPTGTPNLSTWRTPIRTGIIRFNREPKKTHVFDCFHGIMGAINAYIY